MPENRTVKTALSHIDQDPSKVLGLTVGPHTNIKPGQYIPKADAQSPPGLTFNAPSPSTTYMVIGLDIDAPFPSFGVLGPILHWIQPGLKANNSELEITKPFVANYIGPAPPPGSSSHRYVFLLYEQPEGFDGAKYAPANGQNLSNWHRMRYDLDAWAKEIGLGEVVAGNYFRSN
ncbi:phosphatidylethanolamine-binding protein [Aspergillus alliaceus]|uniref:Phosphatidylethanolamine-binding protein n=1 Tax=Petromyces alliaceus TaxID=209559 RepID=A0A5N7CBG2_PETAA|nr:phosphatidylethanolamine-binding protein [Aspergillus alliaceus]